MRNACVKCGGSFRGPQYDARADRLRYCCTVCGYEKTETPNDAPQEDLQRFYERGRRS